ncbi:putative protein OS=Streptomyces griseomycini OX=66895 GN=FHS37_002468 PE=4 SV=1 [Streptomyces griseomycini]|uniref:Uncharacterized protein n=1 Tax=Streptomyces griseomycini TaxID=66895 RepID=A0A7W7LXQ4_9ACTN|nr:hypothetical protein [Streptomyces griseomycini]GGR28782.1 hypothetical protein GCM10015536_38070 [Streptomyces griseomycini]
MSGATALGVVRRGRLRTARGRLGLQAGRAIGTGSGVRETATTTSDAHDLPRAGHGERTRAMPFRIRLAPRA